MSDPRGPLQRARPEDLRSELERMREFRDGFLRIRAVLADAKRRGLVPDEALTWEDIAKALVAKAEAN